jgi:hypothetical protein
VELFKFDQKTCKEVKTLVLVTNWLGRFLSKIFLVGKASSKTDKPRGKQSKFLHSISPDNSSFEQVKWSTKQV